jgi:hypothetical protein
MRRSAVIGARVSALGARARGWIQSKKIGFGGFRQNESAVFSRVIWLRLVIFTHCARLDASIEVGLFPQFLSVCFGGFVSAT